MNTEFRRSPVRTVYPVRVLVVYYTRFGAIENLAERIAEGAREVGGIEARLLRVDDSFPGYSGDDGVAAATRRAALLNQLVSADALVVGSPGYFGSMASPIKRFFEECATAERPPATDRSRPWRQRLFHNKVGAAFTATATPHGGNEQTLHSILTMFMHLGMIVVTPGQQQPILENDAAPYGATTITGPTGDQPPGSAEQEAASRLGQRIAETTVCLRLGQARWPSLPPDGDPARELGHPRLFGGKQ